MNVNIISKAVLGMLWPRAIYGHKEDGEVRLGMFVLICTCLYVFLMVNLKKINNSLTI